MERCRILLVDDHPLVRTGLKTWIDGETDLEVVGEVDNGRDAVRQVRTLRPDVVIMDISMPGMDGVRTMQRLKDDDPDVKVLMLTIHKEESVLRQALQAGASGFLLKRTVEEEIIPAIRAVAESKIYIDPTMMTAMVDEYMYRPTGGDESTTDLSKREVEVLRRTAWGYGNKEIAAQLDISVKTVEAYKANLSSKIGLRSRTDIVRYAVHQGWMNEGEG